MALLRLSNGRIYTTFEDINRLVAPLSVGAFKVSDEVLRKASGFSHPLSKGNATYLLNNLAAEDRAMVEGLGFTHRRVGEVIPKGDGTFLMALTYESQDEQAPPAVLSAKEIAEYLTPHYVHANDWHFVFSGAIVKGVQLEDGMQGVVYCPAGNWIRLAPTVLNWPIFPWGEATAAISCFDRPCEEPFHMELHPEVAILPEMRF